VFTRVLGRSRESKSGWHFVRRHSVLDCAKHRETFSHSRHQRQFQLDSTQPGGVGSAKTPENVSPRFGMNGRAAEQRTTLDEILTLRTAVQNFVTAAARSCAPTQQTVGLSVWGRVGSQSSN